jgi:hypothetical protein
MALPKLITYRQTFLRPNGQPEQGFVRFEVPGFVRDSASDDVMAPGALTAALVDGDVTLQVPSTDDPAWSPQGWTYKVTVSLSSGTAEPIDVAVPYDSPNDELDLLLPVPADSGELYAPVAHTHTGFATDAELAAALQLAATDDELAVALTGYLTAAAAALTYLTKINPEIVNSALIVRKADWSAALRFRSTGDAVDIDLSGTVVISSFAGTPDDVFAGAQVGLMRLRAGSGVTLAGLTEFGDSVYGGQQKIDSRIPAEATATLGGKAGAPGIHGGIKATPGAPTAGTWAKDSVVIDSAGVLHLCTAGGTPGVWT